MRQLAAVLALWQQPDDEQGGAENRELAEEVDVLLIAQPRGGVCPDEREHAHDEHDQRVAHIQTSLHPPRPTSLASRATSNSSGSL